MARKPSKKTTRSAAPKPKKSPPPAMAANGGSPPGNGDQDVSNLTDAQLGSAIRMICAMGGVATVYRKDGKLWLHEGK